MDAWQRESTASLSLALEVLKIGSWQFMSYAVG
jgi:hypothetical protein